MAKIKSLYITSFKVVSYLTEPGIQEERTNNTWILDPSLDVSLTPGGVSYQADLNSLGTADFHNVVKTNVLLARMEARLLDIGNVSYAQFRQLPPSPQNQGLTYFTSTEDIGWVELGKSVTSIYYEDCNGVYDDPKLGRLSVPGRLPTAINYFDLDELGIGTLYQVIGGTPQPIQNIPIVSGIGNGKAALDIIKTYNPNNGLTAEDRVTFGPDPLIYPALPLLGPPDYLRMIIRSDGASIIPGPGGFQDAVTLKADLRTADLQIVSRYDIVTKDGEHYKGRDSDSTQNNILYGDGRKLRWGYSRRIVENAFSAEIDGPYNGYGNEEMWETKFSKSQGKCIPFPFIEDEEDTGGGDTGGDDGGGPDTDPTDNLGKPNLDKPTITPAPFPEDMCPPLTELPINFPPHNIITNEEMSAAVIQMTSFQIEKYAKTTQYQEAPQEGGTNILRGFTTITQQTLLNHTKDPREGILDNISFPSGVLHAKKNRKTCTIDVFPAFRDKDGDIPEIIGPIVSNYMEDIRIRLQSQFYLDKDDRILKSLGTGSTGYTYYSDGHSYKELLGEAVMGCGDPISFHTIPEIFVEIYKPNESEWIKEVRRVIERPTSMPPGFTPRSHDLNLIRDVVDDLVIGIPDEDRWTDRSLTGVRLSSISYNYYRKNLYKNFTPSELAYHDFYPSRWKLTMYPIYQKLCGPNFYKFDYYEEANGQIFVNNLLALGDWDNFWKDAKDDNGNLLRNNKHICYVLDDIISSKNIQTPENRSEPLFTSEEAMDGLSNIIIGQLRQKFLFRYTPKGSTGNTAFPNPFKIWKAYSWADKASPEQAASSLGNFLAEAMTRWLWNMTSATIEYDVNRTNPSRNSFEIIRNFKKGAILLESKSGDYITINEPCPIIFLGYNDEMIINPDLSSLSKDDKYEEIYFESNLPVISSSSSKRIEVIPALKRRNKYYGKNPLLDIYYLNIAEKSNKNPGISPFRMDTRKTAIYNMNTRGLWPSFDRGQYPSIFPPLWNEPYNTNSISPEKIASDMGLPETLSGHLFAIKNPIPSGTSEWDFGDVSWLLRTKNTILDLKDRWEIHDIIPSDDNYSDAFLRIRDKTPILDIYNMLMEMHVKGVSWKEILKYVNVAKSAISGNVYGEKLNIQILEDLYNLINTRLYAKRFDGESYQDDIPLCVIPIDFGYLDYSNTISKKIMIINKINLPVKIDFIYIDSFDENDKDIYGNQSSILFEIQSKKLKNGQNLNAGTIIPPGDIYSNGNDIRADAEIIVKTKNVNFKNSIQNGFLYAANITVGCDVEGDKYVLKYPLTATVLSGRLNITSNRNALYFSSNPLGIPSSYSFGVGDIDTVSNIEFDFSNVSETDTIEILDMKIHSQSIRFFAENPTLKEAIGNIGNLELVEYVIEDTVDSKDFMTIDFKNKIETLPGQKINFPPITFNTNIKFISNLPSNTRIYMLSNLYIKYRHFNVGRDKNLSPDRIHVLELLSIIDL